MTSEKFSSSKDTEESIQQANAQEASSAIKNDQIEQGDAKQTSSEKKTTVKREAQTEGEQQKMRWYAVRAQSGFENYVANALTRMIAEENMQNMFGRIVVATEKVLEIRSGQKRRSERKLFPGYVLVQMIMTDETWHLVRKAPRVLRFIGGTAEKPAPITDQEVERILTSLQRDADKPRPKIIFEPGEVVRVIDGPFKDFNGVVEEVNYEKNRLRVAVLIFGRSTPVELEFNQVEKG